MRVLVTGGFGYVGGRLVRALAADGGCAVTAASRRLRIPPHPSVRAAAMDWDDEAAMTELCRGHDAIVHLASMTEPESQSDPLAALHRTGFATHRLVQAARSAGVRRLVYVSTSKLFGRNPIGVIDENTVPRPVTQYAITHQLAEDYVLAAADEGAIEGVVLRLTNAVGAPADPDLAAWNLIANDICRQAATQGRIVLTSSGLAWRNFIAMADVVSALRYALSFPRDRIGNGLFHLGGGSSLQIGELAARVAHRAEMLFGVAVPIERRPAASGDTHPLLDWRIDKLMATGWAPAADLNAEIDVTLKMCRDLPRADRADGPHARRAL